MNPLITLSIPAVRLTCIACFPPISQSILNRFWWNLARPIFESCGNYLEIFIGKYCIAKKLDHLACNAKNEPYINQCNGFIEGRRNYKFTTMSNGDRGSTFKLCNFFLWKFYGSRRVTGKQSFHQNQLRLDLKIGEKHAIQVNLTAGITNSGILLHVKWSIFWNIEYNLAKFLPMLLLGNTHIAIGLTWNVLCKKIGSEIQMTEKSITLI